MYRRYVPLLSVLCICHISICGSLKDIKGGSETPYVPTTQKQLPIVYHDKYTPNLGTGIMWAARYLHAFDSTKYQQNYDYLRNTCGIRDNQFSRPEGPISDAELQCVHTPEYVQKINNEPDYIAQVLEVLPLAYLPNWWLQSGLMDPMRYATAGTVLAAKQALQHGYAINLGGGFHHAETERGCGFCALGDIQLAVEKVRDENPNANILIIDLDAHQGNGYEEYIYRNYRHASKRPRIFDMYNNQIFPGMSRHQISSVIDKNVTLPRRELLPDSSDDTQYNNRLQNELSQYLDELEKNDEKPDLIIYNAGTDTYQEDNVGHLNMSKQGIIERDQCVWSQAQSRNIPIAMLLSGGYTPESANIIKASITAVLRDRGVIRPNE